jgi:hypothetical protein
MPAYYFYLMTRSEHIHARREAYYADDADAIDAARKWLALMDGYAVAVEVWERARRVGCIETEIADRRPISASPPATGAGPQA